MRSLLLFAVWAAALPGQPAFVPADFKVPVSYRATTFQLKPFSPDLAKHDFDAYMSSIDHLRSTFSSGPWPNETITMADAIKDVDGEFARFNARKSFTYAILTVDGARELGCVYISPSPKAGYDAMVRMWVTKAEFDKGLEPVVIAALKKWLRAAWPFQRVAWPKREISAEAWAALPKQ